jgi:hypothetical protein
MRPLVDTNERAATGSSTSMGFAFQICEGIPARDRVLDEVDADLG